jgi:hypothetical protein
VQYFQDDISQQEWYQNVNRGEADEVLKNFGKVAILIFIPTLPIIMKNQTWLQQVYESLRIS